MASFDRNGIYPRSDSDNPNRRRSGYYLNIIFLCTIILISIAVCILMYLRIRRLEKVVARQSGSEDYTFSADDELYTKAEYDRAVMQAKATERRAILLQIQSSLESGNTTISMLRELFPETVVVMHDGRYFFYPLQGSLALNPFQRGSFGTGENGAMSYLGERNDVSVSYGIAVSEHTGEIEWDRTAEDQISFAMIRAGSLKRDEEEDGEEAAFAQDDWVEEYLSGAVQAGITPGIYVDLNAFSAEEAKLEAESAISLLSSLEGEGLVIAAYISVPSGGDPLFYMGREEWTECADAFCDTVREAGYTPVLYGSLASFHMLLDLSRFEDCGKWIFGLTDPSFYPYEFRYWEYSEVGSVSGIENSVRLLLQIQTEK